jgi:hypothetical protein
MAATVDIFTFQTRDPLTSDNDSANSGATTDIKRGKVWVNLGASPVNLFVCTVATGSAVWAQVATADQLAAAIAAAVNDLEAADQAITDDLATKVPSSRSIGTTAPLTGGGDLSADRTLAMPAATASQDGYMTQTFATKLNGIAPGATANATDAQLRDRSTHTGAQAISTVTGLQTALDGKADATATSNALATKADATATSAAIASSKLLPSVADQTNTAYQAAPADADVVTPHNNASAITVTVVTGSLTTDGQVSYHKQKGAGQVTFTGSGVTLDILETAKTRRQGSIVSLRRISSTSYELRGDVALS